MKKFNESVNFNIISIIIVVTFLVTSSVYGRNYYNLDYLRPPLITGSGHGSSIKNLSFKQRLAREIRDIWREFPDIDPRDGSAIATKLYEKNLDLFKEAESCFGGGIWVSKFAGLLAKPTESNWHYTNSEILEELLKTIQASDERWIVAIDGQSGKTTLWYAIQSKDVILGELFEEMEFVEGEKQLYEWFFEVVEDEDLPFDVAYGITFRKGNIEELETWADKMAERHTRPTGLHGDIKKQIIMMFANGHDVDGFIRDYLMSIEDRIVVYNANNSHLYIDKKIATSKKFPFCHVAKIKIIPNKDGSRSLDIKYSAVNLKKTTLQRELSSYESKTCL